MDLLNALVPTAALLAIAALVLPRLDPDRPSMRLAVCTVSLALIARYVWWRLTETLPPADMTFETVVQWAYMAIEAAVIYFIAHNFIVLTRTRNRSPDSSANQAWLAALPKQPLVDVLIPTYNEDRSIIERTIVGALALDHPRVRIWVLDDGKRPWLEDLCRARGVRYIARPTNENAKAGNLNIGLAHIGREAEPGDFVAVFDADFVPQPNFLKRTLALFRDERIGLVQTPQHFFNSGPMQFNFRADRTWPEEQRMQYDVTLPSRDAWGTAFCSGTSFVVRYRALCDIAGIPTESVTEDYLTTVKLDAKGWKSAYLNERLSAGLAPAGVGEYVSQRARWCLGTVQIFRGSWGLLSRRPIGLIQRLHLLDHFGGWAVMIPFRLLRLFLPILYWFTGVFVMATDLSGYLAHAIPAVGAVALANAWWSRGRMLPLAHDVNQLMMAFAVTKAAIVGLLRPQGHPFRVTAKDTSRLHVVVHWPLLARFAVLLALTVCGAGAALLADLPTAHGEAFGVALWMTGVDTIILSTAIMACIERPRARLEERFPIAERAIVETPARSFSVVTMDLSATGARIRCATPLKPGASIVLHVKDVGSIPATVGRRETGTVALALWPSPMHRDALLRKLHARDHHGFDHTYRMLPFLGSVAGRLFGRLLPRPARRAEPPRAAAPEPAPQPAVLWANVPAAGVAAAPHSDNVLVFPARRPVSRDRAKSAIMKPSNATRAGVRDLSDPA